MIEKNITSKFKEKTVLVLNYTLACPLKCDHCCYACHPDRNEKMPIDLAKSLIAQAADMKDIFSSVGFTGGEPMMYLDEIFILSELLKKNSMKFTIATACHWAKSFKEADMIIKKLKYNGLIRLNVSHDKSHAEYVPKEFVLNAMAAAENNDVETFVTGTFYSKDDEIKYFGEDFLEKPKSHTKIVANVGRATKKKVDAISFGHHSDINEMFCYRPIHHDITVFYDGKTYPCCSTFNRSTDGIVLGNVNNESLFNIYAKLETSLLFMTIKRQGFKKMYSIINKYNKELYNKLPREKELSGGPCKLCHDIFSNAEHSDGIKDVFEAYEHDFVKMEISKREVKSI